MKIKIFRYDKITKKSRYDVFELEPGPGMTVLGALFHIQDRFDDSLAFRYSCRGAVCGSCAMLINKVPRLACRTQLSSLLKGTDTINLKPYPAIEVKETWNPKEEVLVEPLPHLPVMKDLIVDMDKFFKFYRAVQPVFKPADEPPEKERLMDPSAVRELERFTNCVLCAACFGACPVDGKNPEYFGPAALAKLYRFHIDPRELQDDSRLLLADNPSGWWGCEFHGNCMRVCPKGVPPNLAISRAQQQLKKKG
jgi:succinate dehydrogenase/fumarate reductase iron-sulfur protein